MRAKIGTIAILTYAVVLALALIWVGGSIAAPLLEARALSDPGGPGSGGLTSVSFIYQAYGRVCHQLVERSFQIAGHPLAVCARCLGVYGGYLAGLAVYPFARSVARTDTPRRVWLLIALAPVGVDFLGGYSGMLETTLASRAATGMIAGLAGAFYTLPGLVAMASTRYQTRANAVSEV